MQQPAATAEFVVAARDRRRAGLRIEPPPQSREALLPAMDVAAFVGLAERGPLHQPVLLRDALEFDRVFGSNKKIAWDAAQARWVTVALRGAVRAFFENGGRRCWVVRVADEATAVSGRLQLQALRPLVRRQGQVQVDAATTVEASSPGSWSDGLALRVRLRVQPLPIDDLQWQSDTPQLPQGVREAGRRHLFRLRQRDEPTAKALLFIEGDTRDVAIWWHHGSIATAPPAPLPSKGWVLERLSLDLQCAGIEMLGLSLAAGDKLCWTRAGDLNRAFPLGGVPPEPDDISLGWYPEDIGSRWSELFEIPADFDSALRRDGLSGPLHASFIDVRVAATPSSRLLDRVRELRYGSDGALPLRGLHALLASPALEDDAEAVSLIVLPDATQPAWTPAVTAAALEPGIVLADGPQPEARARFAACAVSPWPSLSWGECSADQRARRLQLAWVEQHPAGAQPTIGFEIEETGPSGMRIRAPHGVTAGTAAGVRGERSPQPMEIGVYRFRLRALRELQDLSAPAGKRTEAGPWSATLELTLRVTPAALVASDEATTTAHWKGLATVHQAALSLAAARGDLVALLGLPEQADQLRVRDHIAALRALEKDAPANWPPPSAFGALYAPWLLTRSDEGSARWSPPDGAVCGVVARRCLERGPWVAPANATLRGALGIVERDSLHWLGGLNAIEVTPRGMAPMDACTLSTEPDLLPLQVRRLMAMLRRLLEREGRRWAFEPLSGALQRAVSQRLGQVLEELDRRGAFADAHEPWQLRVEVESAGEATLLVELRIRPAPALREMRIQLRSVGGAPAQWQEALA